MDKIKYAVFPVAGLGTRILPATKIVPKEMFPIAEKPLIAHAVEEAYSAGIRQMIFITNSKKQSIESYFNSAYEVESGFKSNKYLPLAFFNPKLLALAKPLLINKEIIFTSG